MKTQRLDYNRFAEALAERGLVDHATINHVLQQCAKTGASLPEVLVLEQIISDWELSRVSCELYNLPFLPVDSYGPRADVVQGLDADYLRRYRLVPLDRYGKILTIAMPGMVPKEILAGLVQDDTVVMPVVGSVDTNLRWLHANLPESRKDVAKDLAGLVEPPEGLEPTVLDADLDILGEQAAPLPTQKEEGFNFSEDNLLRAMSDEVPQVGEGQTDDWGGIFDAGDEAVQFELDEDGNELP